MGKIGGADTHKRHVEENEARKKRKKEKKRKKQKHRPENSGGIHYTISA
jgi:mediator of RNA polymerase II transcription subunit 19